MIKESHVQTGIDERTKLGRLICVAILGLMLEGCYIDPVAAPLEHSSVPLTGRSPTEVALKLLEFSAENAGVESGEFGLGLQEAQSLGEDGMVVHCRYLPWARIGASRSSVLAAVNDDISRLEMLCEPSDVRALVKGGVETSSTELASMGLPAGWTIGELEFVEHPMPRLGRSSRDFFGVEGALFGCVLGVPVLRGVLAIVPVQFEDWSSGSNGDRIQVFVLARKEGEFWQYVWSYEQFAL